MKCFVLAIVAVLLSQNVWGQTDGNDLDITVSGVTFKMKYVQGGTFKMGSGALDAESDETPVHNVTISGDYYIGETEVTCGLWKSVMGRDPSYFQKGDNYPVENVSWDDCKVFIDKLNQQTGKYFRLPTEAEWEYAARGGSKSKGYMYSGSNVIGDVAVYDKNSYALSIYSASYGTHIVKSKSPNELGIYDMSGNVYEWCEDRYGDYPSGSVTDPSGASSGGYRVLRGGTWYDDAAVSRVSSRGGDYPAFSSQYFGFRLVLTAKKF